MSPFVVLGVEGKIATSETVTHAARMVQNVWEVLLAMSAGAHLVLGEWPVMKKKTLLAILGTVTTQLMIAMALM